jgi:hypothetical protein
MHVAAPHRHLDDGKPRRILCGRILDSRSLPEPVRALTEVLSAVSRHIYEGHAQWCTWLLAALRMSVVVAGSVLHILIPACWQTLARREDAAAACPSPGRGALLDGHWVFHQKRGRR